MNKMMGKMKAMTLVMQRRPPRHGVHDEEYGLCEAKI